MREAFAFGRAGLFASADPPAIFPQSLKYGMVACTLARMDSNLVVRALGALAHESRLAIFRALVVAGQDGLPAGEIAPGPTSRMGNSRLVKFDTKVEVVVVVEVVTLLDDVADETLTVGTLANCAPLGSVMVSRPFDSSKVT